MFGSAAGSLAFKSWPGQIEHRVVNGSPPLQHFYERSCIALVQCRGDVPANSLHAWAEYSEYNERFFEVILPVDLFAENVVQVCISPYLSASHQRVSAVR